ncbi:hypothetical protein AVEN_184388-1 [Araneus ventricosus]|uniref:RNase H type-1 domain-containing protein n=1 Tax=Araneus ventricosus TaxID=182803 RepID=A0A4Y2BFF3_ARAVE|nr:hypothetical protein AVEN_184388-1 [Araneus ventricosus]
MGEKHAGNFGNEKADQLTKATTQNGQSYTSIKLPKSFIKTILRKTMLEKCQVHWNEGVTGRSVFKIIPKVSLHPMNWVREDIIFFTEHGPFPVYLKDLDSHATTSAHTEVLEQHSPMPQSSFSQSLGI